MNAFEKDLLYRLLIMFEQDIRNNGVTFHGEKAPAELIKDFAEKVNEIRTTLGHIK